MRALSDTVSAAGAVSQADHASGLAAEADHVSDPAAQASHASDPAIELRQTLTLASERHGPGAVLLCSFQKEESVLLDELLSIGKGSTSVRIVTIDTGVLFPETLQTWREFEERFGITVEVQDASGFGGAGGVGGPWTGPEHCCSEAKVAALQRSLEGASAWITGIRREQSPTRAHVQAVEPDENRGIMKYNPLAAWTERDLWTRIHKRNLPYHPLHDRGYDSIGCATCTQPGSGRDGRWAGSEKTECGLHLPLQDEAIPVTAGKSTGA